MVFGYFIGSIVLVAGVLLAATPSRALAAANRLRFIPYRQDATGSNRRAGVAIAIIGLIVLAVTAIAS